MIFNKLLIDINEIRAELAKFLVVKKKRAPRKPIQVKVKEGITNSL